MSLFFSCATTKKNVRLDPIITPLLPHLAHHPVLSLHISASVFALYLPLSSHYLVYFSIVNFAFCYVSRSFFVCHFRFLDRCFSLLDPPFPMPFFFATASRRRVPPTMRSCACRLGKRPARSRTRLTTQTACLGSSFARYCYTRIHYGRKKVNRCRHPPRSIGGVIWLIHGGKQTQFALDGCVK